MADPEGKAALNAYLKIQRESDIAIIRLLESAASDVDGQIKSILDDGPGAIVRREQARLVKKALLTESANLWDKLGLRIRADQVRSAVGAVNTLFKYRDMLRAAGLSPAEIEVMRRSALATAARGITTAITRHSISKLPLSEKVYKSAAFVNGMLDRRVDSALARGLSAREFVRDVKDLVSPRTAGGVRYAALRLARTELNNAFHATSIETAKSTPWITGLAWNLSGSHPAEDICDRLAADGPYDPNDVPRKPHPQCLCFTTPDILPEDDFIRNLRAGTYDSIETNDIGKIVGYRPPAIG